ncbi:hypothetical protein ABWJ26_000228 [Vibrio fluvialis]
MIDSDSTTQAIRKALNILFLTNGQGTSIGIFVGIVSDGLITLLMPTLKMFGGVDFYAIRIWHLMAFWVVVFNIKPYLNRNKPDPKIEAAFNHIRNQLEKKEISEHQAKLMYYALTKNVVESVTLPSSSPTNENPTQNQ